MLSLLYSVERSDIQLDIIELQLQRDQPPEYRWEGICVNIKCEGEGHNYIVIRS